MYKKFKKNAIMQKKSFLKQDQGTGIFNSGGYHG